MMVHSIIYFTVSTNNFFAERFMETKLDENRKV
jgi:hypothetical protein